MVKCIKCGGECRKKDGLNECLFCGTKFADDEIEKKVASISPKGLDGADIYEKVIGGILEICWKDAKYTRLGSGFLVSGNGYCITNAHVVTDEKGKAADKLSVKLCNKTVSATVVALGDNKHGMGDGDDLALLRLDTVPDGAAPLKFEIFDNVRIGEKVFVIGNSLGRGTCITSGIVSDKERVVDGRKVLMTDCAVNHGNSGGPIFNDDGLVIGAVVSMYEKAKGMNFAIPSSIVERFINRALSERR